jgi:hypothetical protein
MTRALRLSAQKASISRDGERIFCRERGGETKKNCRGLTGASGKSPSHGEKNVALKNINDGNIHTEATSL